MRLLRGESLDRLARESGQPAGRIAAWREEFLAAGREGLKSRSQTPSARSVSRRWRSTSCARSWSRRGTLSRRGARSERGAARTASDGVPGGRRVPVGGVRAAPPPARLGGGLSPPPPWTARGDGRLRAAPSDTSGARRLAVPGRGPPQGVGPPAPPGRPYLAQAGPAAHARGRPARTDGRRSAGGPSGFTPRRSRSARPTPCGRPTRPRATPTRAARRCSASSTMRPVRPGAMPRWRWTASPPRTSCGKRAPSLWLGRARRLPGARAALRRRALLSGPPLPVRDRPPRARSYTWSSPAFVDT